MSQPMQKVVAENRLPIIVSCAALAIAVIVGLIPVWQQNQREAAPAAPAGTVALVDLAALDERIKALEESAATAATEAPEEPAPVEEPAGMDPALRAELDLIVKGLVNQTGRVSRLQDEVAALTAASGEVPQLVTDEISLAKRGLVNLTRRINEMDDGIEPLASAPKDIDRLNVQMSNVERAVTRLNLKLNQIGSAGAPTDAGLSGDELSEISTQLEAILTKLSAN